MPQGEFLEETADATFCGNNKAKSVPGMHPNPK